MCKCHPFEFAGCCLRFCPWCHSGCCLWCCSTCCAGCLFTSFHFVCQRVLPWCSRCSPGCCGDRCCAWWGGRATLKYVFQFPVGCNFGRLVWAIIETMRAAHDRPSRYFWWSKMGRISVISVFGFCIFIFFYEWVVFLSEQASCLLGSEKKYHSYHSILTTNQGYTFHFLIKKIKTTTYFIIFLRIFLDMLPP